MGSGIGTVECIVVVHNDDLWVADSTADSLKAFTYSVGGATMGSDVLDEVPLNINRNIQEMVSVQGYIVAGTEDRCSVGDWRWSMGGS